ncbi:MULTISPECIES: hypothetical protein [Streptomyces]|uniref:L,D-transpeptidase n=1 Tax=Streptomyces cadmiisoli TaxID=2184053 RepID=A0A2Z4IYX6_9ACTN|nr:MULTISPECIES: hypothetical protein [Streptomyces]AWW38082.1 hypothetical protein DN051_16670 [Streptomyces cadmiisoli]
MASGSAGIVTGLTAAALAAVGFLAHQAATHVPAELSARQGGKAAAIVSKAPRDKRHPTALPGNSGIGERVVYSLDDDRVWLVGADNKVRRTFRVTPSPVDPAPGSYTVTSRSGAVTGSDGIPVEHVVRFSVVKGVVIGFSAAKDGSMQSPDPSVRTGGIRQSRVDGDEMWYFATIGQKIVVIR